MQLELLKPSTRRLMTDENGMVGFYEFTDRSNYPYPVYGRGVFSGTL
jgi:hypothetical protein